MAFLIESLTGTSVARNDERRLTITRRPLPVRPRDFFELFIAMGQNASFQGLARGIEQQNVEPRLVVFGILGRWPTSAELEALEQPYKRTRHIQSLIASAEFRTPIIRRLFEAFPERQRLFYVRIPRCAGEHAMATLNMKHPILPTNLGADEFRPASVLVPLLGNLLNRFGNSRTLVVAQPKLSPFIDSPAGSTAGPDPLHLNALQSSPCRATDLIFAIVRPPEQLLLSLVNGTLTALRRPAHPEEAKQVTTDRARYAPLPRPEDHAGWQALGRRVLSDVALKNPICSALGDGTAANALAACSRILIQLVALDGYQTWARSAFECYPPDRMNVSDPVLTAAQLTATERANLAALTAEDQVFYDRFEAAVAKKGIGYVSGPEL